MGYCKCHKFHDCNKSFSLSLYLILKVDFMSFLSKLEDDNSPLSSSLHVVRTSLIQLQQQVLQLCQQRDLIKQQLEESNKQVS